jgi:hypothetical protein
LSFAQGIFYIQICQARFSKFGYKKSQNFCKKF